MTSAHVCNVNRFYWPRTYCPLSGGSAAETPESPPGLALALDLVTQAARVRKLHRLGAGGPHPPPER
ncbi:hypothetical protein [Actinomadura atramentaria]|uniref:hypothetical protein n=1 Tax=Actinomadura atramentaria TaxID=1990 RepID=UPI000525B7B9|nr:hypothetical protein [Actinomadura atramentaria]